MRALVVGDVLRRLTGRVLAQTYATQLQQACLPFQFGLSTRAGTEALARVLKVATELDPRATVLSVDAAGAYDHVSRGAMLEALHARPELQPLLPYARQFYATPSSYTWVDDSGTSHTVSQGEGGEQGDPLMPGLYSLAVHAALQEVQAGHGRPARRRGCVCLPRRRLCRRAPPTRSGNCMLRLRLRYGGMHTCS